ncbi:MAG: hypothetical protein Q8L85_06720 [Alphaproteobacteria bacterium]|nr:hypothetical protein [Alphaproteobacteria bacterium]
MIQRICLTLFMLVFTLDVSALSREEKERITKEFLKDASESVRRNLSSHISFFEQLPLSSYSKEDKEFIKSHLDQLVTLTWLKELDLSGFELDSFPNLSSMTELKVLKLSNNNIQNLPDYIGRLDSLRELNLFNNLFTEVPKNLKHLKHLHSLSLSNNKISIIPLWLIQETQIKQLGLKDNFIRNIPYEFRNWILLGGYIDVSGVALQKTSEGINLGLDDLEFLQKKQKEKKYSPANFNNKSLKSAIYQKIEKQNPHINLDNLSEIRTKDLPETSLEGNEMISLFNKLLEKLNLQNDNKPFYLDFYELTGFWPNDSDPITNKKRFQEIAFPFVIEFLKSVWDMPFSKTKISSFIIEENKLLFKKIFTYIITKLNLKENKDLVFSFMYQMIESVINPFNLLEIIHPTLLELQKRDLYLIEDIKDRLYQFIVYKKESCLDLALSNIDKNHQIPIKCYYKLSLNKDLGLSYQDIMPHIRLSIPANDPFEGNPWTIFDCFLMRFTPNYLIVSIIENTKKNKEENSLFTTKEIAQFLKENDEIDGSNPNYWEAYFTEDPFIDDNQSTLKEKGAQKVLELFSIINEE